MGKKTSQSSPTKTPNKPSKKHQLPSLIKILRPKVYITNSSNFKNLVQELTGNGSPPPSFSSAASPPIEPTIGSFVDHACYDVSFDSSCFGTPVEGSPDLMAPETSFDYMKDLDLESLIMGLDSITNGYDSCHGMVHQEVCHFGYDYSSLI